MFSKYSDHQYLVTRSFTHGLAFAGHKELNFQFLQITADGNTSETYTRSVVNYNSVLLLYFLPITITC